MKINVNNTRVLEYSGEIFNILKIHMDCETMIDIEYGVYKPCNLLLSNQIKDFIVNRIYE
jgi:hypothetical protein